MWERPSWHAGLSRRSAAKAEALAKEAVSRSRRRNVGGALVPRSQRQRKRPTLNAQRPTSNWQKSQTQCGRGLPGRAGLSRRSAAKAEALAKEAVPRLLL